jgi:hypothetical protein
MATDLLAVVVTLPPACQCGDVTAFGHTRWCSLAGPRTRVVRLPQRSACFCPPPGHVGCGFCFCEPDYDNERKQR